MTVENFTPAEIAAKLKAREIVLIDVREPSEYAAERIHGALLFPLSTFDPTLLPEGGTRQIIFHCGSSMRSSKAIALCDMAGFPHRAQMAGGIMAWKAAGLPTIVIDPVTGKIIDRR